jgi:hypothetical protein
VVLVVQGGGTTMMIGGRGFDISVMKTHTLDAFSASFSNFP